MMIAQYEQDFLQFIIDEHILRFGNFTLKSGRQSPYFYNSGLFNTGGKLLKLGRFYAEVVAASGLRPDVLFGPAYKGIPLVSATSMALAQHFNLDLPYTFNRKEAKKHGEGGTLVGAELHGKVLIVDDVISAGLTIGESIELIRQHGANPAAVVIAFDRQERGAGSDQSAVQEVQQRYGLQVLSISRLTSLMEFLQNRDEFRSHLEAIKTYRGQYGVA